VSESDQIVAALHAQGTPVKDYQFYATVEFLQQCLDLPSPAAPARQSQ
jgi:hypothetical protein